MFHLGSPRVGKSRRDGLALGMSGVHHLPDVVTDRLAVGSGFQGHVTLLFPVALPRGPWRGGTRLVAGVIPYRVGDEAPACVGPGGWRGGGALLRGILRGLEYAFPGIRRAVAGTAQNLPGWYSNDGHGQSPFLILGRSSNAATGKMNSKA